MAKLSKEDILQAVEEMSVLELNELVKALEEKFDVQAVMAAPAAAAGGAASGGAAEATEEQTVFNVVLQEAGAQKLQVIKVVREIVPTLGLKEAKDLVDGAPKDVVTQVNRETAEEAKKKLEAVGAKVELK